MNKGMQQKKKKKKEEEILLRSYRFKNVSNMSSLIANKIKIDLHLVSIKLLTVRTILCATIYNFTTTTTIFLFVILFTQLFAILLTTVIFKPRLFSSHATRVHTRLTEFLLLIVCFVLPFYSPTQTV